MNEWHESAIGELGRVVTGKTPPAAHPEAFGEAHPFVTPTDMVDQRYMVMTDRYLSADGAELLRRLRVPAGALMVSCIGWQLGKVAFSTADSFTNQQINTIIPDTSRVDPLFLYYHLRTRREELKRLASGGTRTPILNKSRFERLTVPLPPRPSQELIATFLGSIDDLIENNQRRVAVLEEMTRAIYHEWFVKFRYPGHEDVPLVDSMLGPIPQGWRVDRLGAFAGISSGKRPPSRHPHPTPIASVPVVGAGSVMAFTENQLTEGRVLVTGRVGTHGIVQRFSGPAWPSDNTLILRAESHEYIFQVMLGVDYGSLNRGAAQPLIAQRDLSNVPVIWPDDGSLRSFERQAGLLMAAADSLAQQSESLISLRDMLLPKLVTGQIDVSALDLDALVEEEIAS